MANKKKTHKEVAKKGGKATLKKHTKDYFKKIGSKGGKALWKKLKSQEKK